MTDETPESVRADVFLLWRDENPILLDKEPQVNPAGALRGVEPDGSTVWYSTWDRVYRPTVGKLKQVAQELPHRQYQMIVEDRYDTQIDLE